MGRLEKEIIKAANIIFNYVKVGLITGLILGAIMAAVFYSYLSA